MKMFRLGMFVFSLAICGFAVGCADDAASDGGASTDAGSTDAGSEAAGSENAGSGTKEGSDSK